MTDKAEEAYWRFDARRKGYGEWKEAPQSERDAFKAEYTDHAALLRAVAKEVGKMRHDRECFAHTSISDGPFTMKWIIDDAQCNCPRGKVLAMLEVEK